MLSPALAQQLLAGTWYQGSSIAFDCQNDRAYVGGAYKSAVAEQLTLTRATVGMHQWQDTHWSSFGSGILRRTDKGLLVEEARTSDALWSRDMTNVVWVKVNMTAALTQVGIDLAANSATLLTATAGNATILQTITLTSQADTYSVFLKRVSGSGNIQITVDGGVTWTTVAITTTFTQFQVVKTAANPVIGIRIVTNGDVIVADFNQLEPGGFATSPILTTTTAATRNADVITLPIAFFGMITGSVFAEWLDNGALAAGRLLTVYNNQTNKINLGKNAVPQALINIQATSTVALTSTGSIAANTVYREALAFAAGDAALAVPGALSASIITAAPTLPVGAVVGVSLGSDQSGAGAAWINGSIRKLAIFPSRMGNQQLLNWAQGTIGG